MRLRLVSVWAAGLALVVATSAAASDATLRVALNSWSTKIGVDARVVARDAARRSPQHMTADAIHFHNDALRAGTVIASRTPSTAKGRKARRLALGAFVHFARAGSEWAASGRARRHHHRADAIANAQAGARDAHAGNVLLVAAGKLLRR